MYKQPTSNSRIVRRVKKRKLRKRIFFIAVPLLVFLSAFSYFTYLYITADSVFSKSYQDDGREKSELRDKVVNPSDDNVSVLIMGVDASDIRNNADNSRTDTMMVATLNIKEKSVKLLSIPRDSLVYIPFDGSETRINHAHSKGGTTAAVETVENLLNIPIDYWVKVNFNAFIDVVDAIDGIKVDVPYEFREQDSNDVAGAIHLLPGEQQLDGEEALALARTRKLDNDIERGKRQQEIIKAIVKKAVSMNSILKIDDVMEAVGSNMTTNMSFSDMKSFISYGTSGKNLKIDSYSLEGEDYWVYNPKRMYFWKLDEEKLVETKELLQQHLDVKSIATPNDASTTEHASPN
ncbi:LCP family protein [Virgibacillus sp. MG-45]|uniref:LCP family protein n=1 Tax=Virgibacillus sp. MG-45 TaxID=3102791 RepID=UPI002EDB73C2